MSVNIRGHRFYSASEVSAMTPSGTMDSQWETYTFPIPSGAVLGWSANKFMVNKITGLVVGWIGINFNSISSFVLGTVPQLGIHSDMDIKYSGNFEYGYSPSTASQTIMCCYKELNGKWDTDGTLTLQGEPTGAYANLNGGAFIEHYAHIGSRYGKITTVDVKPPVYLAEGAFYDTNTADLITGRAWLKIKTIQPTGYDSRSFVTWYKNLWSGEVIMQYNLYPTTAGNCPSIAIPSRCAVVDGRNFYTDIRYTVMTAKTAAKRQSAWMRLNNNVVSFNAYDSTWLTGSIYYPSNSEVRSHNVSYETTNGLYFPEVNVQVPSAQSNKWPSSTGAKSETVVLDDHWNTSYYKARSGVSSWVWRSKRTGMVFTYFDMNAVTTSLPDTYDNYMMSAWHTRFLPSYRYKNSSDGSVQPIYFSGAGFIGTRSSTTADAVYTEYTCNLAFCCGKSLGVQETNTSTIRYNCLHWGTPGQYKPIANSLACFTGQYLGNSEESIVR